MTRTAVAVVVAAAVATLLSACPPSKPAAVVDAGAPSTSVGSKPDTVVHEDIKANYDANTAANPKAKEMCAALFDVPTQKREVCCKEKQPPAPLAATCVG